MAKDLNKVMLIGRLGADPELRYTPNGSAVTAFGVAVGRQWKDANGEVHDDTEWFSVVAWNKLAEVCSQYLTKGARVYIEGRLQTRSWDDAQTGEKRYKTEVIASDMILLDSRRDTDGAAQTQGNEPGVQRARRASRSPASYMPEEDIPF